MTKEEKDLEEWQNYLQLKNQVQHAVSQMIANNNRHFREWDYERRQSDVRWEDIKKKMDWEHSERRNR